MLAQKQNNNFLSLNAMKKVAKLVEVNEMDIYEVVLAVNNRLHLSTPCSTARRLASSICRSVAPHHACCEVRRVSSRPAKSISE
jgi:hypothetical protein